MAQKNILYCGMGGDIMSPLLLVPDFDRLYVIDIFYLAFCSKGTWSSMKSDIKYLLLNGDDRDAWFRKIIYKCRQDIHYLDSKAEILEECEEVYSESPDSCWVRSIDPEKQFSNKLKWSLKFMYCGKIRELICYMGNDFRNEWPEDIKNISALMHIGADFEEHFSKPNKLTSMIKKRCLIPLNIYGLAFNHKHYPEKIVIKNGKESAGTEIAKITVNDIAKHIHYISEFIEKSE